MSSSGRHFLSAATDRVLPFRAVAGKFFLQICERTLPLLTDSSDVENRSSSSKRSRAQKVQAWSKAPKIRADERRDADDQIANKVVGSYHLSATCLITISNDERLARRVAKFFETANHEGNDQCRETSRH